MKTVIAKAAKLPGIQINEAEHAWEISVQKQNDLQFEIMVPREALEWFVTVKTGNALDEVWSDWVDYYETDGETADGLRSQMTADVGHFLSALLNSDVRLVERPGESVGLEWKRDGHWEKLTMVPHQ
ncbi:MAG: hypothetical protein WCS99_05485 [Limisphaerales bacterium]